MTHLFKKQNTMLTPTTTTSSALGMHRDSRVITKVQPKIRIIHIFAPEIIKTDVANFRELVQRLTGKPDVGGKGKGKEINKTKKVVKTPEGGETAAFGCNNNKQAIVNTKLEVVMGSGSSSSPSSSSDHHHNHEGCWRTSTAGDHISSSGGYLNGFTDLDDHYSFDFTSMFHLGAADGSSSHLNSLGENTQLSFRG